MTPLDIKSEIEDLIIEHASVTSSLTPDMSVKNNVNRNYSINGIYTYESRDASIKVTIYGKRWSSKIIIKSGFGAAYDNQNAMRDSGFVKGNDLVDKSGFAVLGRVSGTRLRMAVGGDVFSLSKSK